MKHRKLPLMLPASKQVILKRLRELEEENESLFTQNNDLKKRLQYLEKFNKAGIVEMGYKQIQET